MMATIRMILWSLTCVAMGAARRPSFLHTNASIFGERCALVPTAPDSLPTAATSRALFKRANPRPNSSYISAILNPNVVGSACIP